MQMQTASDVVEKLSVINSSSVLMYDLAEHVGFGQATKKFSEGRTTNVTSLQTRAGAGLSLIGRLSEDGMSKDSEKDSTLATYTTPTGLAVMASSFSYLPEPTAYRRIVIQVPALTAVGQTLELSSTLAPLNSVLGSLPETFTVLFSSSPQQIIDFADAAYAITDSHVIHIFDHYDTSRERRHALAVPTTVTKGGPVSVRDVLKSKQYPFFEYAGDKSAADIVVLLNGPLASSAKAFIEDTGGLGVVVVNVLRPWDDVEFLACLPSSVKTIHVVDEVLAEGTRGVLFTEVFGSFLSSKSKGSKPTVRAASIVPSQTLRFAKSPSSFTALLNEIVPHSASLAGRPTSKKLLFFGTPSSPVSRLPSTITNAFSTNSSIDCQTLANYDLFSKPEGLSATRIVLSPASPNLSYLSLNSQLGLGQEPADPKADFVAVLDQSLLKTHSIDKYLKKGSTLLLISSWTSAELASNLPRAVLDHLRELNIALYNIDIKAMDLDPGSADIVGHLVFLRLYLGATAAEGVLREVARKLYPREDSIDKLNAKAWASLERFIIPTSESLPEETQEVEPKDFEFNAVSSDVILDQSSLPGSQIESWHRAARNILFPDVYNIPADDSSEEYLVNPALRPELPERTFLVTCSVNRRLTPLDYDRNVFHLEFDTKGTGLKYEIGEALGVHGWNDADEVLNFCDWYSINPNRLITTPVPGVEGQVHTRTIFQALQQQIDLFGKPPKSFYADLANHAINKKDKLTLQFIGSPEGSSMFKKLSEKETLTFADILQQFKSARPSVEVLCQMIGDIKPRHYSIASAQSVVGDRVDLLVVTVEWATPSGELIKCNISREHY